MVAIQEQLMFSHALLILGQNKKEYKVMMLALVINLETLWISMATELL